MGEDVEDCTGKARNEGNDCRAALNRDHFVPETFVET